MPAPGVSERAPSHAIGLSGTAGSSVSAPSRDTSLAGTNKIRCAGDFVRVATYNICAQNWLAFAGRKERDFKQKFGADLAALTSVVDIMCFQGINEHWAAFVKQVCQWETLWLDNKAFCWRPQVVSLKAHEWKQVYPEVTAGLRRKFRGVLWVTHRVLWESSLLGCKASLSRKCGFGLAKPRLGSFEVQELAGRARPAGNDIVVFRSEARGQTLQRNHPFIVPGNLRVRGGRHPRRQ